MTADQTGFDRLAAHARADVARDALEAAWAEVERLREEAATGPSWNAVALRSALVAMTVERDDLRAAHERLDRDARAVAGRSLHYEALAEATRLADEVERLRRIERAEVADLKFDVERLEKAVDVLAASVNAATIRAEKAEAEVAALRAERDRWRRIAMDQAERPATYASADVARDRPAPMKAWGIDPGEVE